MYGGYGGMGGMGGMYGGMYGGMPGGMPGMMGPGGDPNNPESLTHRFNMSTQATFQMLEGIVGAFGGFAQMLESTYMATHSSFFGESAATSSVYNCANITISHGCGGGTIWQSPGHTGLCSGHLYSHAVDTNTGCKVDGETTTR